MYKQLTYYKDDEEEQKDQDAEHAGEQVEGGVQILQLNDDSATGPGGEQKERKTTRFMTKYERARVLGTRALQIR